MSDAHQFRIELLGTTLTIRSSVSPAYFNRVRWYLEKRVKETEQRTKILDPVKIALITNINIIDELLREKDKDGKSTALEGESEEMECITQRMITEIDGVI